MKHLLKLLTIITFIIPQKGLCQVDKDSTKLYRIETVDGNEYVGHILGKDSTTVRLKTSNIGIISILKKEIVKQKEVRKEQIKDGTIWYENLQATRYFWSPNGYGLQEGEAYYQNIWILYNQSGYGFSNNFSVAVGLFPLFLFGGTPTPVWITPKFSIPIKKDKINLGAGILAATIIGESNTSFGITYGVFTYGSRDRNMTIGMGYGYAGKNWAKSPIITFSSMLRAGKRGYFITENYYINVDNNYLVILMIGGRSLIKKVGLDYGLVIPISPEMEQTVAIPWLGITIPIQSK